MTLFSFNPATLESKFSAQRREPAKALFTLVHAILVVHPQERLFIVPLDWTAQHMSLLCVSVQWLRSWSSKVSHRLRYYLCSAVGKNNVMLVSFNLKIKLFLCSRLHCDLYHILAREVSFIKQ